MPTTTCIAPLADLATLCGAPATTTRIVEGLVCALCAEHAAEIDRDTEEAAHLTRAVAHLDATQDGDGWVYYEQGTDAHYRVSEADMVRLGKSLASGREDAYSLWCAETMAERVEDSDEEPRRLDLWEDNAGGLCLVDRAAGTGWRGFEAGQNDRRTDVTPRDWFTLASDAPHFDDLGEGSAYEAMDEDAIEALYATGRDGNAPAMVASWERGKVTVHPVSIGASARWYLAGDGVD